MNALTPAPRRFTSAEFHRIAQSGGFRRLRVELRRGWIVEMSPQYTPYMRMKLKFVYALQTAIEDQGLALEVGSEGSVSFGDDFEPMPDIVVFDPALVPPDWQGPLPAAAVKLVIEVASSSLDDDLGDKRAEYAENGLAEYWVADVKARVLHRFAAPRDGAFTREDQGSIADGAPSFTIAGLALPQGAIS